MSALDIIDKTCTAMNKNLRFLTRVFHSKANSDESYRVQKTLNTAINADPTVCMKRAGPYLFKYAEPISNHEEKFFIDKEWDDDDIVQHNPDKAMDVIKAIKTVYVQCDADERAKIMETVSDMLSHYCEYRLAVSTLDPGK